MRCPLGMGKMRSGPGRPLRARFIILIAVVAAGCSAATEPIPADGSTRSVIDNTLWVVTGAGNDPFLAGSESVEACPPSAHAVDPEMSTTWYSVETRTCNYLSLEQKLSAPIVAGAQVRLRMFHFVLVDGTGYRLGVAMGDPGEIVAEVEIEGPSQSAPIVTEWTATRDYQVGERVVWNVHNDGANTWSIVDITISAAH